VGWGAAEVRLPLIVLGILMASLAGAHPGWGQEQGTPGSSHGDIAFSADIVTFYEGPDKNTEEVNCTLSNDQIRFVERDGAYVGRLRYKVSFVDQDQRTAKSSEKTVEVQAASAKEAQDRGFIQVLQSQVTVPPGKYTATVEIQDLNARKKTLLSFFLRRHRTGRVQIAVDSARFGDQQLALSDIEFGRSVRQTTSGVFQKSGYEVVPNAERRYGIMLSEMSVFFEVYDLRGGVRNDSLMATYSIVNREGMTMFSSQSPMTLHGTKSGATALFDIASLASGSYMLTVTVRDLASEAQATSERKFDIVWSKLSWGKTDTERVEDLTYIFTEKEMKEFKALSVGEQEKYLVDFWARLDPTPETRDNEAMIEHYRRVAYADEHFGTAGTRGALTDRGRIYIKYGPPDDIQSFYSDYEFVRDKQEIEGSSVPNDPFARVGLKASQEADETSSDQRGGSSVHGKPYETWTYDGPGNPVRPLSARVPSSSRLQFMFADEKGVGDFRLIYSTEKQEY